MAFVHCQKAPYDGGMGMANLYFYYLATRLLVLHDWFNGGWSTTACRVELESLGFSQIQAMLYGALIPCALPAVTRAVLLS